MYRTLRHLLPFFLMLPTGCLNTVEAEHRYDPDRPPDGPINGTIVVNGGRLYVKASLVSIEVHAGKFAAEIAVVEQRIDLEDTDFRTINDFEFQLSDGDGPKQLFYQFRDFADNRSPLGAASVILDTRSPAGCTLETVETLAVSVQAPDPGYTASRMVELVLGGCNPDPSGLTEMISVGVTETDGATGNTVDTAPVPFSYSLPHTLSPRDGVKRLTVRFVDAAGNEMSSAIVPITLDRTPPRPVRVVTSTRIANRWEPATLDGLLDIEIAPPSELETNFRCYESKGDLGWDDFGCFDPISVPQSATNFSLPHQLRPNETNTIRVRVSDLAGNVSTDDFVVITEDSTAPGRPGEINVTPESGAALIQWSPPLGDENDVAGYLLYYDTVSGQFSGTFSVDGPSPIDVGNVTGYRLAGLQNDTDIFVAVEAYDWTSDPEPNRSGKTPETRLRPNLINPRLEFIISYGLQSTLYDPQTDTVFASAGDATIAAFDPSDEDVFLDWSTFPPGIGFGGEMDVDGEYLYVAGGPLGLMWIPRDITAGPWEFAGIYPLANADVTALGVLKHPVSSVRRAFVGGSNGVQVIDLTSGDPQIVTSFLAGQRVSSMATLHAETAADSPLLVIGYPDGHEVLGIDEAGDIVRGTAIECMTPDACNTDFGVAITKSWVLGVDISTGLYITSSTTWQTWTVNDTDLGISGALYSGFSTVAAVQDEIDALLTHIFLGTEAWGLPGPGLVVQVDITEDSSGGFVGAQLIGTRHCHEIPVSLTATDARLYVNLGHYGLESYTVEHSLGAIPVELQRFATLSIDIAGPGNSERIVVQDGLMVTSEGSGGLMLFGLRMNEWEVMSPLNSLYDPAQLIADLDSVTAPNRVNDVALQGDLMFVAEDQGIQIFDLRNARDGDSNTYVDSTLFNILGSQVLGVSVDHGRLVALEGPADNARVTIYDLADTFNGAIGPPSPSFSFDVSVAGTVSNTVWMRDPWIYFLSVSNGNGRLNFVDATNPGTVYGCSYATPAEPADFAISGNQAFIVDRFGLHHLDLTQHFEDIANSTPADNNCTAGRPALHFPLNGHGRSMILSGPLAYVATTSGVEILDTQRAGDIHRIGWHPTPMVAEDLAFMGTKLVVAGGQAGLMVMSVETPAKIARWRSQTFYGGVGRKVSISGQRAYVIDDEGAAGLGHFVFIGDISNSDLSPYVHLGGLPGEWTLQSAVDEKYIDLDVVGQVLRLLSRDNTNIYLATYMVDGIGTAPIPIGMSAPVTIDVDSVIVGGFSARYAYAVELMPTKDAFLHIYDIGDPYAIRHLGTADLDANLTGDLQGHTEILKIGNTLAVFGDVLYVAAARADASFLESKYELITVDLSSLFAAGIAGSQVPASSIRHTQTEGFYENLTIDAWNGLLVGSQSRGQRLQIFDLLTDTVDSTSIDPHTPVPLCKVDSQFTGGLAMSVGVLFSTLVGTDAAGDPMSLGTQVFELKDGTSEEAPGEGWLSWWRTQLVEGLVAPSERLDCNINPRTGNPSDFVVPTGFIDRGGFDIEVEGPFVYLANDRGLEIIDLR